MRKTTLLLLLCLFAVSPFQARGDDDSPKPIDWKQLDPILGQTGTLKSEVFTYTLPRTDLEVAVDSMDVPIAAGIESDLRFFHCSCGKTRVVGQICCTDYELNDVLDALRPGGAIRVANVGPMFLFDRPRLVLVHFQGEGEATGLAHQLRSAIDCIGDTHMTTRPAK